MKQSIALIAFTLTSACSTLDKTRPTMAADPTELGFEGLVYQNELTAAYERYPIGTNEFCDALLPSFQEQDKWSYRRYEQESGGKYQKDGRTIKYKGLKASDRFRCVHFKAIKPGVEGVQQITLHIQSGLALSKLYCENYFDRISLHVGKRSFWQSVTNDVGAAMSAILGLSSAGVKLTSGVGVGFGLADGAFRNYNGQFVVGPDLAIIRNAVLTAQNDKAKLILSRMPTNFADANTAILEHAKICSFLGMKGLVNDRVAFNPSNSREALVEYVAKFQITQEDINKEVEARRKLEAEAKRKADEAKKAADEAAKEAAAKNAKPPVAQPVDTVPPQT